MCSLCADTQHKFHHSHQLYKKSQLREIDIPPRKLLGGRASGSYVDSPKAEDAVFSKFLPYNNADDDGSDPYSSDHFRMYEFKVRKCTRSRSHDWTDCPFAHPGEKARRRDPRRFHYTGTVCSEFRKGHCGKGDNCEFSHGVFECWLHPSRYRTEACKDGKNCKRKVCFFAHSTRQLRIVPEGSSSPPRGHEGGATTHCCAFCHSVMASPTSTLMGMAHSSSSPPPSPPISPDFGYHHGGGLSYKDALSELMSSMEGMSMTHDQNVCSPMSSGKMNLPWLDVNFGMEEQNQPQFVMSPCSPSPGSGKFGMGGSSSSRFARVQERNLMEEMSRYNTESVRYNSSNVNYSNINNSGGGGNGGTTGGGENNMGGPDLGWVNDLLT